MTETKIRESVYGKSAPRQIFDVEEERMRLRVYIKSGTRVYQVHPVGKVQVEKEEFCASKASFYVLKDDVISFNQGDAVSIKYDSESLFFGYVFRKRRDKDELIEVCAYDQMRYMKNKRTYTRGRMSLGEAVSRIVRDNNLKAGEIERCDAMLPPVAADNLSLLDVVKAACSHVKNVSGERYVLFDEGGYLRLKNERDMTVNILIDATVAEDYVYEDTIDDKVYNAVELYSDEKRLNLRRLVTVKDETLIDAWGELVLSKKAGDGEFCREEAERLLKEHGRINRSIVIKSIGGDVRLLPGASVFVRLEMGELNIDGYVRLSKVVHRFENNMYVADVYLDGSVMDEYS